MSSPIILKILNLTFLESLFKPAKKEIHTTVGLGPGIMERRAALLRPEIGKYVILDHKGLPYEGEMTTRAPDAFDAAVYENANAAAKDIKRAKKHLPNEDFKIQEITEDFLREYAHRHVRKK
jgi:hypothetical protein